MAKLHSTLTPSTNVALILTWGLLAGILAYASRPHSLPIVALAAMLGAIGGLMQCRALTESQPRFTRASTMLEIRRAMMVTKWGRRYIYFLWTGYLILFAGSFAMDRASAPWLCFSGYFALMFAREIVTLRATMELSRMIKR